MASLLKRTAVLSFSRFANHAITLFSPLILVRFLTVTQYGRYQEFMLYVGLIAPLVAFSVTRSLPYLIPKYPDKERTWITQTVLITFASTSAMVALTLLFDDVIRGNISFDFVTQLQLYIVFYVNFNFLELYWLGKKRTDYVLYTSSGRLLIRTTVVVTSAIVTQDVTKIIANLIILEALRCVIVFSFALYSRWFSLNINRKSLWLQVSYFFPLGVGAIVDTLNGNAGRLFISSMLGAEGLAFYVVGMFSVKIVNIFRGAIADVIFPDLVEVKSATPKDALPLWQRATTWYSVLLFPAGVLFCVYADAAVIVLFTREYSAAIPIFALFSLQLFPLCFDFHLPLRVQNANRYFVVGTVVALIVNVAMLYPMYALFGMVGPVVAAMLSRWAITTYLANRTLVVYGIEVRDLLQWRELGKVFLAAVVCAPVLFAGKVLVDNLLVRGSLFGALYLGAYVIALRQLNVSDAYAMGKAILKVSQRLTRKAGKGTRPGL